ncbi:hypothetical protein ABT218_29245 [Streptomyces sp. NPDC001455]
MGYDWENILGASGAGLEKAYDAAVSAVIYDQDPGDDETALPFNEE